MPILIFIGDCQKIGKTIKKWNWKTTECRFVEDGKGNCGGYFRIFLYMAAKSRL